MKNSNGQHIFLYLLVQYNCCNIVLHVFLFIGGVRNGGLY